MGKDSGFTQVSKLKRRAIVFKQEIHAFDISVDDVMSVEMKNSETHLPSKLP
jgi:hypothetical protein